METELPKGIVDELRTKSIIAQFVNAISTSNDIVKYAIDKTNPNTWYVLIHNCEGPDGEFKHGEYLFQIQIPRGEGKAWLEAPPRFIAFTPNGLYDVGQRCCVHIGEYHRGEKQASIGVSDFVTILAGGLIQWKELTNGINIIRTSAEEKRKMADQSVEYNRKKYPSIMQMIDDQYAEYSKSFIKPGEKDTPADRKKRNMIILDSLIQGAINPKETY
jgi:hypothetical protein